MGLFRRKPIPVGRFRVVGVTRLDGIGTMIVNGVPQQKLHVSGLVDIDGRTTEAAAVDVHLGIDRIPNVGAVLPVEVLRERPLKLRIEWGGSTDQQQVQAVRQDATAQVIADLVNGQQLQHTAGETDALGIALTAPGAQKTIAEQVADALGTPISMDVDLGGAKQHLTANPSEHLTTAEAAELLRTGTAATAVIRSAARVPIPSAMLPGPEASLWDLDLEVHRIDGTHYDASTRVGFRTEARRHVLGVPGLTIPVRIDSTDDTRVAVDSTTFNAINPDAPPG